MDDHCKLPHLRAMDVDGIENGSHADLLDGKVNMPRMETIGSQED